MSQEMLEKLAEVIDQLREILEALEETPDIKSQNLLDNAFGNCEDVYNQYNV
jgi:DNA-binding ferritin-like protein